MSADDAGRLVCGWRLRPVGASFEEAQEEAAANAAVDATANLVSTIV